MFTCRSQVAIPLVDLPPPVVVMEDQRYQLKKVIGEAVVHTRQEHLVKTFVEARKAEKIVVDIGDQ